MISGFLSSNRSTNNKVSVAKTYVLTGSRVQRDYLSILIFFFTHKKEQDKQDIHRLIDAPHEAVSRIRNPLLLSYPNTLGNTLIQRLRGALRDHRRGAWRSYEDAPIIPRWWLVLTCSCSCVLAVLVLHQHKSRLSSWCSRYSGSKRTNCWFKYTLEIVRCTVPFSF